ncbi:MAG: hypothetical protein IT161_04930 [Bryobacterales bacterium]|nr:hypothetical protein [Bryobacterales bacterium]
MSLARMAACAGLAAVLLAGCSRKPAANARVDAALAPLIPADSVMLAGIRLDKLKDTPFYKTFVEGRQIPQLEEFAKRTGLDPRRDLWEIVLASNGKSSVALVRGKFGGMFGQEPRFEGSGALRRNYKGYSLQGNQEAVVTFMNASVAVAGPPRSVEAIIDGRDDAKANPPQALLDMVHQIPGTAQIWMVTTAGGSLISALPQTGNLSNLARAAASLRQASLFADVSHGLDLKAYGDYPDAATAKQIHDALRGLIGIGRLSTKASQPDMLKFFDSITVTAHDAKVDVSIDAPFEVLEKLIRQAAMRKVG